ncbi:hypothetical protein RhiirA1_482014 [Rhizophagus irregularis]|uniref:Uncharacterized protein n=1 Tax=Rhizophagus irregularis TaxID=588596 RepID=A0A2N0QMD6_9GLOM|nr:hypothetical protein RhiirA1_482014 [Rhizophagus irregularis]
MKSFSLRRGFLMIVINTYIEDVQGVSFPNYVPKQEELIRVDNTLKMKQISSKISSIYNRYCIEIIQDGKNLRYSEILDLTQPIVYYLVKERDGNLTFKIQNQLNQTQVFKSRFTEEEFLSALFQNLVFYLQYMRAYNTNYVNYWMKRYGKELYEVAIELESRYLVTNYNDDFIPLNI